MQAPSTCTSHNYIQYGYAIRPILNVNKRVLTVHAVDYDEDDNRIYHDYFFEADLNQVITVTAVEDDGNIFDHWEDSDGNLFSEDNPLEVRMYDNIELTAVFEAGSLIEHHVTFYDENGSTVLYEADFREGKKPVYRGETPTKAGGYVFNGWSPAITKLGESDATYTATYLKTYSITTTAAHGTVELTPGSPTDQVSDGVYKTGTSLTMTVTADPGYVFTQWSDGNTQNPRTVSVTADASYTAEFRIESLPVSVDAYQNAPKDVKQILYLLAAQAGDDDKTYTPVDLGVGVAFADRNVGAATTSATGDYFMWGKTTAATSGYTNANALPYSGLSNGYTLTAAQDAATVNMGDRWRMPTDDEWYDLKETAVISADKSTFTNPQDNTKFITLPATGYYSNATKYQTSYRFYWSSVTYYSSSNAIYPWTLENYETGSEYAVSLTMNGSSYIQRYYGMPVRAVYQPSYTPVTLTINAGERKYIYYCQPGQQVTVTAHPNTAANYLFDEWEDNHSTNPERTFTVSGNVTYTAKMKDNPEAAVYTATFVNHDGTILQAATDVIAGRSASYVGEIPAKGEWNEWYSFTGWTDDQSTYTSAGTALPGITRNTVYTATFAVEPFLTFTNKHVSEETAISMKKYHNSATTRNFYVRIIDASGKVTTDWNQKSVSSTTATAFGSIPAGGKMQIYGSNTAISTSNTYYLGFVISGGSPEVSGNILSLVTGNQNGTVNSYTMSQTYCFSRLFLGCTALTNAEHLELPSTTLSTYCYYYMFSGCTGLKKAPKVLPATTLPQYCYGYMFNGCTALTTSPEIEATSASSTHTCKAMFYGCTALTKAPSKLKITGTAQQYVYNEMFRNCSSLETAPDILATSQANYGWQNMFNGCSKLKKIRIYCTGNLAQSTSKTASWMTSVPSTGEFY
ncbi:MAG: leucine-rich repeat protein, partial [Paludibacteraceae bacterium]|nr:leucine-rich repeat protein [Paludibacteraceae bacterium]